jgi:hypothetical protein
MVTSSDDDTARLWWWGPDVEGLLAEAGARQVRELTCPELEQELNEALDCALIAE